MKLRYIMIGICLLGALSGCSSTSKEIPEEEILKETENSVITKEQEKPEIGDVINDLSEDKSMTEESHNENNVEKSVESEESTTAAEFETVEEAVQYNTEGFRLYQSGNYVEALEWFNKSIKADPNYFYPHFNYACTLGVLMKEDYPTWYETKGEALDHLNQVLELNPSYREKIQSDPDLEKIRKEFRYYKMLGYKTTVSSDVKVMLCGLDWYVQGLGVMSVLGEFDFKKNGEFTMTYPNLDGFDEGTADFKSIVASGIYEIQNSKIILTFEGQYLKRRTTGDFYNNFEEYDEKMVIEGFINSDGSLQFEDFEYNIYPWYDEFSA